MFHQKFSLCQSIVRVVTVILGFAIPSYAVQAQTAFSSPLNISNSTGISISQRIAVDTHGNVDTVWTDNTAGNYVVLFSRSSNAVASFSTPLNVSNNTGSDAYLPQIAVDNAGDIYTVWQDYISSSSSTIDFSVSTDGGSTFSAPRVISQGTVASGPCVAVGSTGKITFAWADNSSGNSEVFFSQSSDRGATISAPADISNNSLGASFPALAVDAAANVYATWSGGSTVDSQTVQNIFFAAMPASASAFSTPTQVSNTQALSIGPFTEISPSAVVANSMADIDVVWSVQISEGDFEIFSALSNNGGATFSSQNISTSGEFAPSQQVALGPDGAANIVWQVSQGDGAATVSFARSISGGPLTSTNLANIRENTPSPQLAIDSLGAINVVFYGGANQTSTPGVLFSRSTDSGTTFSNVQAISADFGSVPQLALDSSGNSYVVWDAGSNNDVFFSRGTNTALASLSLNPTSATGGGLSTGTVTLNAAAPATGAIVTLSSGNGSVAAVPASVTIPVGATSATFNITTTTVSASTQVPISASFAGVTQSATFTVLPPAVTSATLDPPSVTGGNATSGTITLSGAAPSNGVIVALSSNNPSVAAVPASVTIPGGDTSATFTITTKPVTASTPVTISAGFDGISLQTTITVLPAGLKSIELTPSTIRGLGFSEGSVTLSSPAPKGGAIITLSNGDPREVLMLSRIVIPAGASSADFTILALPVFSSTAVTISASYEGATDTVKLTIQPLRPVSFREAPRPFR